MNSAENLGFTKCYGVGPFVVGSTNLEKLGNPPPITSGDLLTLKWHELLIEVVVLDCLSTTNMTFVGKINQIEPFTDRTLPFETNECLEFGECHILGRVIGH